MRLVQILAVLIVAIGSFGLTGCGPIADERALLLDPRISGSLEIETREPKYNDAGLLLARATIWNRTDDSLRLLVQTTFLGADGVPLQGNPSWENVVVPEYGTWNHERTAIDPMAVDYRVQLREGKTH